jgi:hypothetical protein
VSPTTSRSIRRLSGVGLLALVLNPSARSDDSAKQQSAADLTAPVQLTAQQDHQRIMDLLHIKSLRRGADGNNRRAPNAANYDESRANPYPDLPDPLLLKDGRKVTTAELWWTARRPEVIEEFDREIYGRAPADTPKVKWDVTSTTRETVGDVPVITKKLVGHVDNSSYPQITVDIQLTLATPANAAGPVPVIMEFGFGGFGRGGFALGRGGAAQAAKKAPPGDATAKAGEAAAPPAKSPGSQPEKSAPPVGRGGPGRGGFGTGPSWQQQVLARGWGYAIIIPNSIQADNGAGLTRGIIGLCNKGQPRNVDDWGALRAWAWGASRALDYFETDGAVDARQVGIEGLSRYGKAAIVTMAYDPRFAIAFVGSSGEGGVKLHRRNFGELVENVASSGEYHWMAGNFLKYAGPLNWNDLPVDSHELVALCAPRPVFISAGTPQAGDGWVDAKGMFLAAAAAGPVYKLLGKKDMGTSEFPPTETALCDGEVAFRQHSGGHTTGPNWPTFLTFASRYIKAPSRAASQPGVLER